MKSLVISTGPLVRFRWARKWSWSFDRELGVLDESVQKEHTRYAGAKSLPKTEDIILRAAKSFWASICVSQFKSHPDANPHRKQKVSCECELGDTKPHRTADMSV